MTVAPLLPVPQPSFTVVQPDRRPERAWSDYWQSLDAFVRDAQAGNFRPLLQAARTYYVSNNTSGGLQGNNSNDGLTPATAFLTVQHALDIVFGTIDLHGFNVTIQVADGTYNQALAILSPQVGAGVVTINGNATTPSNVLLQTTSGPVLQVSRNALVVINNVKIQATGPNGYGLYSLLGGILQSTGKLSFGSATGGAQMFVTSFGTIDISGITYSIDGDANQHALVQTNGAIRLSGCTANIPVARAFTAFAYAANLAVIECSNIAFPGQFIGGSGWSLTTGKKFDSSYNAVIYTNTGNINWLPGNIAGTLGPAGGPGLYN